HRVALVPMVPGRPTVRGHALHRPGPAASTDSVACFPNGHPVSPVGQPPGAGQPGKTGTRDGDVPSPAAAMVGTNPPCGPTPTEHGPGRGRGCLVTGRLTREVQTGTDRGRQVRAYRRTERVRWKEGVRTQGEGVRGPGGAQVPGGCGDVRLMGSWGVGHAFFFLGRGMSWLLPDPCSRITFRSTNAPPQEPNTPQRVPRQCPNSCAERVRPHRAVT